MITLKTSEEVKIMIEGGKRLKEVVKRLLPTITPGITTKEINNTGERLISKYGGEPSFKKVPHYVWGTCLPVNEQVVHTPPSKRVLKDNDVLTIDIGFYFKGFHTDYATTLIVGKNKDSKLNHFLKVGEKTLQKAIQKVRVGGYIGEISQCIEKEIYDNHFFILKELTGHGVGKELHEEPFIPGFLDKPVEKTYRIREGLVVAIEVIYSFSTEHIAYERGDDWSIVTADKSIAACFEHTVAVLDKKAIVLT